MVLTVLNIKFEWLLPQKLLLVPKILRFKDIDENLDNLPQGVLWQERLDFLFLNIDIISEKLFEL
jgi:hypothetical protein